MLDMTLLLLGSSWLLGSGVPGANAFEPPNAASTENRAPSKTNTRSGIHLDLFGDPLPAGAVARIGTLRFQHGCEVNYVCYSPDGKLIGSVGADQTARVWEVKTGKELRRFANSHGTVAFSPDCSNLITSGEKVSVWDIASGSLLSSLPFGATSFALSTDGKFLAVDAEENFRLWDMIKGKEVGRANRPDGFVVAYSPDARKAAVANEACVQMVDVTGGERNWQFEVKGKSVRCMSFSPDGKTLALTDQKGSTILWDLVGRREKFQLCGELGSSGYFVKFSPDGKLIAMAATFAPLSIWEAKPGEKSRTCATAPDMFNCAAFAPDSKTLVVAGTYGRLQIVEVESGETRLPFVQPPIVGDNVTFSGNGKSVLTITWADDWRVHGGWAGIWDAKSGKDLRSFRCHECSGDIESSADGSILADHEYPFDIWLFNLTAGGIKKLPGEHGGWTHSISGDGKRVASTGPEGHVIKVWDLASGKELRRIKKHAWLKRMLLSPDGSILVAVSLKFMVLPGMAEDGDGTMRAWDVATGRELWKRNDVVSQAFAFSPDGRYIGTSGQIPGPPGDPKLSSEVRLWEATTGREIWVANGHSLAVHAFAFSPDSRTLATGGEDGDIRLWEVASGRERLTFRAHDSGLWSASFSPDGGRLVTGGYDRTALVWKLTDPPARLSATEADIEWNHLESNDARKAYAAVRKLSADPERAVSLLRAHLRATSAPDAGRVANLIKDLGNPAFSVRERAESKLMSHGDSVLPLLRKALASSGDAEAARRMRSLIDRAENWPPERLQEWRALEILEQIGNPEAKEVICTLARGFSDSRLTQAAKASLKRLGSGLSAK
jgi:WD40 repeat protein